MIQTKRRRRKRGKAFFIDNKGYIHLAHPRHKGWTRCRRSSTKMRRCWAGDLFADCEACKELIRLDVKAEMSPYKEAPVP